MAKIRSRVFEYGDEKESSWPPKMPSGDTRPMYWCKTEQRMKYGYPPPPEKFADAPAILQDTIDPFYHHGAERWVDSRSKLHKLDEVSGTITTDKPLPPNPAPARQRRYELKKDMHQSMHKAVAMLDAGTAPLTEETRAICKIENERLSKALNFDAFNVVGKKNNPEGFKYDRRRTGRKKQRSESATD